MIVSKACCAAHPCFCVFKRMDIKRADVKRKNSSRLLLHPSFGLIFSYCVYTDQHSLQYSLCTDQKAVVKSWNLCLIHEDCASFYQRCSRNWTGLGNSACFLHLYQTRTSWRKCGCLMLFSQGRVCHIQCMNVRVKRENSWPFCVIFLYQTVQLAGTREWAAFSKLSGFHVNPGSLFFPWSRG